MWSFFASILDWLAGLLRRHQAAAAVQAPSIAESHAEQGLEESQNEALIAETQAAHDTVQLRADAANGLRVQVNDVNRVIDRGAGR